MTDEPQSWTLTLPFNRPATLNGRQHWRAKAVETRAWRDAGYYLARKAQVPLLERFTVVLHYAPRTNRRRDVDNLVGSLKPLVDGLVAAGVAADDDHSRYTLTSPVIHDATGEPGRMWAVVVDLGGATS